MRLLLYVVAFAMVGIGAFLIGYVKGIYRGSALGVELIARDNLVRLQTLGIDPAVWLAAGPRPSKPTVLQ